LANDMREPRGTRQQDLLLALLRHKRGLSIESLAGELAISRNGVRQHLTALERDGLVARGAALPSGGRPEQLYVLTPRGLERFPRQYSWFAELLLGELASLSGDKGLRPKLAELGRRVAASLKDKLAGKELSSERVASVTAVMNDLGYDAVAGIDAGEPLIDAYNCVFHGLAAKDQDVCSFDLALLSACVGGKVEHRSCMVRGGASCQFRFAKATGRKPGER